MEKIRSIRFLTFILYFCAVSNFFYACTSVMGEYSRVKAEGLVFDIIYGLGCGLNFISDVMMIQALWKLREAKEKFRLFIIWNTFTTCACYVTDIFQNSFTSKHGFFFGHKQTVLLKITLPTSHNAQTCSVEFFTVHQFIPVTGSGSVAERSVLISRVRSANALQVQPGPKGRLR
ncbi:hypothetical protein MRX96_033410 [Rhipicephalus microplus]